MFLISRKILIVEPNFTIKSPRFRNPLSAVLTAALDLDNQVRPSVEVELHLGMDGLDEYANKGAAVTSFLAPHVPMKMALTVVAWNKDDLHNRFVVTDCCAVMLGEGLGLPDEKSSRTDDVLALLKGETAGELLTRYGNKAKHEFSHRVLGTKRLAP